MVNPSSGSCWRLPRAIPPAREPRPHGTTPASAWSALTAAHAVRALPGDPTKQVRLLVRFLTMATRTIQNDGLTIFYLRNWHPVSRPGARASVRSVFGITPRACLGCSLTADGKTFVEASLCRLAPTPHLAVGAAHGTQGIARFGLTRCQSVADPSTDRTAAPIVAQAAAQTRQIRRAEPPLGPDPVDAKAKSRCQIVARMGCRYATAWLFQTAQQFPHNPGKCRKIWQRSGNDATNEKAPRAASALSA